jgi:hypothetical protein
VETVLHQKIIEKIVVFMATILFTISAKDEDAGNVEDYLTPQKEENNG